MSCNVEAFTAAYLSGIRIPTPPAQGWRLVKVAEDSVRQAVDLILQDVQDRRVIVYVERKVGGMPALLSTEHLNISYYEVDAGLDAKAVEQAVRGVGALLRRREASVSAETIDRIFTLQPRPGSPGGSVEIRINRDCNEECLFCNTPPESTAILAGREEILREIQKQRSLGYSDIIFTGRETTLDPNLEEYLRAARDAGYQQIRIQTNGTAIASQPFLNRLLAAGLNSVQISLHTFERDTFVKLVGTGSLLEKAVRGLSNSLAAPGLEVSVLFVVTTMNIGELERFVQRLATDYPARRPDLILSPMAPVGWGEQRLDLIPRLRDLRPVMERALELCAEHHIEVAIPHRCGLPLCATPPRFYDRNMDFHFDADSGVEATKRKAPQCSECRFDSRCVGVWKHYFEVYDAEDIVPVKA